MEHRPYYLSIDMVFWDSGIKEADADWLFYLVDSARAKSVPINFELEHDGLLPHIPREVQVICNIDKHNDIVGEPSELGPGTWADHVDLIEAFKYVWMYPSAKCARRIGVGRCDDMVDVFKTKHPIWQHVEKIARPKYLYDVISPSNPGHLCGLGICLSPNCLNYRYPAIVNTAMFEYLRGDFE